MLQAIDNFREEWRNMRRMFVNDEFDVIFAKTDTSSPIKRVCICRS